MTPKAPLRVVHFHRKPGPDQHSLERVFATVREHLPPDIEATSVYCPRPSTGILNRIVNILWARRNQGDVNHITGDVHYLALGLNPARTILTIHDCASLHRTSGPKRWLLWFFWFWLPLRRVAAITAVSEFTKSELVRYLGCNPHRIRVIADPVPPGFSPTNHDPGPRPTVLQVGTGWNKNLDRVAEALKDVPCVLAVVGPLNHMQRQILESNRIDFRSHVRATDERLRKLYTESDLVVFASLYEGFGLPIIEAQAAGKPLVTSNSCSMPEVAGDGAHLVDPKDPGNIRTGILRVLADAEYREQLVRKGNDNVQRFIAADVAALYAACYLETGRR